MGFNSAFKGLMHNYLYIAKEQETTAMYEVNMPLILPQGKKRIMAMEAFKQYTPIILDLAISCYNFHFCKKGAKLVSEFTKRACYKEL